MADSSDSSGDDEMIIKSMLAAQYAMAGGQHISEVIIDELFYQRTNINSSTSSPN
jgi:hypothetical protein